MRTGGDHLLMMARLMLLTAAACLSPALSLAQKAAEPSQPTVVLQDALPGQAIVYLVRAPHDAEAVQVFIDGTKVATLPAGSFTAISIPPGSRSLASTPLGREKLPFSIAEGERRFFYVSGVTRRPFANTLFAFGLMGAALDASLNQPNVSADSRTWKECSEQEALDLMSIAKLALPD